MHLILDYGLGNVGSIRNMLAKLGHQAVVSGRTEDLARAEHVILPGVGAFDEGMVRLRESRLLEPLKRRVLDDGVYLLGICLGMQMLFDSSEEGQSRGLGMIPGCCERIVPPEGGKVPHMGWNEIRVTSSHPLLANLGPGDRFYFVHSYAGVCERQADVAAVADYGRELVAAVARDNVMGVQFHPEKSHTFGMRLLDGFARLSC
jgi:glutamine amidotransferase